MGGRRERGCAEHGGTGIKQTAPQALQLAERRPASRNYTFSVRARRWRIRVGRRAHSCGVAWAGAERCCGDAGISSVERPPSRRRRLPSATLHPQLPSGCAGAQAVHAGGSVRVQPMALAGSVGNLQITRGSAG